MYATPTLKAPILALAPMSGISDAPFRAVAEAWGAPLTFSEMVASRALLDDRAQARREREKLRMTRRPAGPWAVQLAGCDPQALAEAAKMAADQGAELIDINFGCPAKKVVNQLAGSALMADEPLAGRILGAVVAAVSLPVTLKMRLGWRQDRQNAPSIARIAEESGIQLLTVHGRTRDQGFKGQADWTAVRRVREATALPLLVNGDIVDLRGAQRALAESAADGVMIGRGACGQPWLLARIKAALSGARVPQEPGPEEKLHVALGHYRAMLDHYGPRGGLRLARKHVAWYLDHLPVPYPDRLRLLRSEDRAEVEDLLSDAFLYRCAA